MAVYSIGSHLGHTNLRLETSTRCIRFDVAAIFLTSMMHTVVFSVVNDIFAVPNTLDSPIAFDDLKTPLAALNNLPGRYLDDACLFCRRARHACL